MISGTLQKILPNEEGAQGDSSLIQGMFFTAIGFLWLQLYYSVVPVWVHGEYYSYAWFVPPITVFFFYQRWQERPRLKGSPRFRGWILPMALTLFPILLVIRGIEGVDPTWRPPMLLHAGVVTAVTFCLLHLLGGKVLVLVMIPVIIFALSAIPYPYQLEFALIDTLSGWVVETAGAVFHVLGRPVLVSGGIIEYHGTKVEVTEGCSGIQSLQSLVMVSLYFGEFFRLRVSRRILLTALAGVVAVIVNIGRAIVLAHIRFTDGEEAFDASHDGLGHAAFAIGGLSLLFLARFLISLDQKKGVIRRRQATLKPT